MSRRGPSPVPEVFGVLRSVDRTSGFGRADIYVGAWQREKGRQGRHKGGKAEQGGLYFLFVCML